MSSEASQDTAKVHSPAKSVPSSDHFVLDFDNYGLYQCRRESDSWSVSQWRSAENSEDIDVDSSDAEHLSAHDDICKACDHDFANSMHNNEQSCSNQTLLIVMLSMTLLFAFCELFFGFFSASLALVADAFHMLSDAGALAVALYAMRLASRREHVLSAHSFGWQRAETIGSLVNGVYLTSVCAYTILESINRMTEPKDIESPFTVLVVGIAGFLINLIGFAMFFSHRSLSHHGHHHHHHDDKREHEHGKNANMHGVFLHIAGDLLGSIIVIGTALAAMFVEQDWKMYLDPVCSILFSLIVLKSAIPLLRHSASILMQSAPAHVSLKNLLENLKNIRGVADVHELHVWQMTPEYLVATAHLSRAKNSDVQHEHILDSATQIFCSFGIHRNTIQVE